MTSQELEMMAAKYPTIDGAYQSGCHTASVGMLLHKKTFKAYEVYE